MLASHQLVLSHCTNANISFYLMSPDLYRSKELNCYLQAASFNLTDQLFEVNAANIMYVSTSYISTKNN